MSDLISRQAAIDALDTGCELLRRVLDNTDVVGVERAKYEWSLGLIESCIADMKALPSAQPEITLEQIKEYCRPRCLSIITNDLLYHLEQRQPKRTGKWIFGHTLGHSWMKCSECLVSQDGQTACFSYCPNCGARMEGE